MKRQEFIDRIDEAICELSVLNEYTCWLISDYLNWSTRDEYSSQMTPRRYDRDEWLSGHEDRHNLRFMLLLIFKENVLTYKTYKEL